MFYTSGICWEISIRIGCYIQWNTLNSKKTHRKLIFFLVKINENQLIFQLLCIKNSVKKSRVQFNIIELRNPKNLNFDFPEAPKKYYRIIPASCLSNMSQPNSYMYLLLVGSGGPIRTWQTFDSYLTDLRFILGTICYYNL